MVRPGMMISERYEIIEKIGSGGMADVFRAKCHRLNRFVAIKFLKQEYCQDTKFVNKFRGEAQSVAGLSHHNIVGIFDVGEDQGLHYIVMEYIEGITLKKYINDRGRLSVKEAVGISLQIAAGLNAAHANNIIHRDIKPQNILISRDGTAKVTDFGIAKAASSNTITSNAMGSVHYISPEQARGGFSNEKSDIYSLGVTMYEMLSGRLPFTGESTVAIALAHIQDEAIPLCELDPSVPVGLSNIVKKAMQKKQEMRYASAAAMMADLKMFLSDPTGDYGVVTPLTDTDSPTIFIKDDEMNEIRKGAHTTRIPANIEPEEGPEEEEEVEEKEQGDVDPKLEKALVFGSIAVAIIIGLIIIFMLGKFIGLWGGSKPSSNPTASSSALPEGMTIVPDVTNMQLSAAREQLQRSGLSVDVEEEADNTKEEGIVISTDPVAGTKVAKKTSVKLTVSSGSEEVTIPNVTGKTFDEASSILSKAGFTVDNDKKYKYDDKIAKEKAVGTSPSVKAPKGGLITIYLSKGPENTEATVPNLIGMTKTNAMTAISKAGLNVGDISYEFSSDVAKGSVSNQSLKAGDQVTKKDKIDITISKGAQTSNYQTSVTIGNPFSNPSDPAETFKFYLSQDGDTKLKRTITLSYAKFPYELSVSSNSGSDGEVLVYRSGKMIESYNISFTKQ